MTYVAAGASMLGTFMQVQGARAQGKAMEDKPADANPATTAREMCDRDHGASRNTTDPTREPTHPR